MPCYRPLDAFKHRSPEGKTVILFSPRGSCESIKIPCGQCIGCRLERSRQWAVRMMHECSLHEKNCFVTLTYDDEHLPDGGTLVKSDFQKFVKKLRDRLDYPKLKYYHCGEYGEKKFRPHYHAVFFNLDFDDKKLLSRNNGNSLYRSEFLNKVWGKGHCSVGSVTFESAAYVARYCMKKITGERAEDHYDGRLPEYATMSNGIGRDWLENFADDVYPNDYVVVRGFESRPPRYYDKVFGEWFPGWMEEIKEGREKRAEEHAGDNTPERLRVKERVREARIGRLARDLEKEQ